MALVDYPDKALPNRIRQAGAFFVCLACFFTPLSTSLLGLFAVLAFLCWLGSGSFFKLVIDCRAHPSLLLAILLFSLMCLAVSYSPAELAQALDTLKKYREVLFLPVMISLLSVSGKAAERAETGFVLGCLILMLISYAMAMGIIPSQRYGHSVVFHITHSFFMAVLAFWTLHHAVDAGGSHRLAWLSLFLAATVNLFYIAPGRTGMFVFICLMLLFVFQRLTIVKTIAGMVLIVAATTAVYHTSDNFSGRIQEVVNEIEDYQPGRSRTSIGQRFDWWFASVQLIKEKPVLGHGTGSFYTAQRQVLQQSKVKRTDNPHNEYLFLAVQFGLLGLALFVAMIVCQLVEGRRLPKQKNFLLQGVIVALLSGSLMNSLLFDSHQGHFYLFMTAALMAGRRKDRLQSRTDTGNRPDTNLSTGGPNGRDTGATHPAHGT